MKSASAKAKGRRLQRAVVDAVAYRLQLPADDIRGAVMGESGEDVPMSAAARAKFPFSMEVKNQERLNIWAALEQCAGNAGSHEPLVVFKRNGTEMYAALRFHVLLNLVAALVDAGVTPAEVTALSFAQQVQALEPAVTAVFDDGGEEEELTLDDLKGL